MTVIPIATRCDGCQNFIEDGKIFYHVRMRIKGEQKHKRVLDYCEKCGFV